MRELFTSPLIILGLGLFLFAPVRSRGWGRRIFQSFLLLLILYIVLRLRLLVACFLVATLFAYLFTRPTHWLEQRGVRRPLAILAFTLPFLAAMLFVLALLLPPALEETFVFLANVPGNVQKLIEWASPQLTRITGRDLSETMNQWYPEMVNGLRAVLTKAYSGAIGIGKGIGAAVIFLLLVPIITYYLLADREKVIGVLDATVPEIHRPTARAFAKAFEVSFGRYLEGLLIVSIVVGSLTGGTLAILGMEYAASIGIVTGILNLIPIVGFAVSLILAMIAAAFSSNPPAFLLWVPVVFLAVNFIEGNFLTPRIVGRQIGVHPLVLLTSILVFSTLFGITGVILAIPTTLFLKIVLLYARSGQVEEATSVTTNP